MKDNFSKQSAVYKKYRPEYPQELYECMYSQCKEYSLAWDCATGNGQVAKELSKKFNQVIATDISAKQLEKAWQSENIQYQIGNAIVSSFAANSFDLITVAQALHWFQGDAFFDEALRVLKPKGVLACFGYGLIRGTEAFDTLLYELYVTVLGDFWDVERQWIDKHYEGISFPEGTKTDNFNIEVSWSHEHFMGYLESWSSVQHFINQKGYSPLDVFKKRFAKVWEQETLPLYFPVFLKSYVNG